MAQQVTADPPSFASIAPGAEITKILEAVVMKALAKQRDAR